MKYVESSPIHENKGRTCMNSIIFLRLSFRCVLGCAFFTERVSKNKDKGASKKRTSRPPSGCEGPYPAIECLPPRAFRKSPEKELCPCAHRKVRATKNLDRRTFLHCCHRMVASGNLFCAKPWFRNLRIWRAYTNNSLSLLTFPAFRTTDFFSPRNFSSTRPRILY